MHILESKLIMNLEFIDSNMDQLTQAIHHRISTSQKTFIVTANPEIVMYAQQNESYNDILKDADYITPDGIGVVIGSRILGKPVQERLAGFDLLGRLLELSNENGYKVYFLGASPETIGVTVENIQRKYSKLNIVGFHHGYFDHDDQQLVAEVKSHKPDLIFVGLGFPKQEQWIHENMHHFDKGVFMGVGGSFDVWAGKVKRAPLIWQKLYLEWLYRLIKQPTRWRRMLVLPLFLIKVIQIRLNKNKEIERG